MTPPHADNSVDTSAPGQRGKWPWWATSLLSAAVAMILTAVVLYLPPGRGTVVLIVGVFVFVVVLRMNPDLWLRRMAGACLGMAASTGIIPNVEFDLGLSEGSFAHLLIDSGPVVPLALVLLAGFFAYLDYKCRRPTPPHDGTSPSPPPSTAAST